MHNFWPSGIEIPSKSPLQILDDARSRWKEQSDGILSLEFREEPGEGYLEVLIVSIDRSREEAIFVVEAMPEHPYPCSILCEMEDRLDCATQGEFRAALEVAMNWSHVKSRTVNMLIWIVEDQNHDSD